MRRIHSPAFLLFTIAAVACGQAKEDPGKDAPKVDEVKPEEAAPAEPKVDEVKPEEAAPAEPKVDEVKPEEGAAGDNAAPKVDDMLTLAMEGAKKPAVKFPHKAHTEFEAIGGKCGVCHHDSGEDTSAVKGCMTEGCHDGKAEGVPAPKDAFHKTCKDGCHKDVIKEGKSDKLKKVNTCSGCHAE